MNILVNGWLLRKASLVLDVKNPPANAGDLHSIPGPGRPYMPRSSYAGAPQLLSPNSRAPELQGELEEAGCTATKTQRGQTS